MKREIRSVNRIVFFGYLFLSLTIMSIFHLIGGRASAYYCLRLPMFALSRFGIVVLVALFCALCSLAVALYINRFNKIGLFRKMKVNICFMFYIVWCALWYPTYFSWQREVSALFILFLSLIIGTFLIKTFYKKCFAAASVMLGAQMIIIYMFFLQLCINILN